MVRENFLPGDVSGVTACGKPQGFKPLVGVRLKSDPALLAPTIFVKHVQRSTENKTDSYQQAAKHLNRAMVRHIFSSAIIRVR